MLILTRKSGESIRIGNSIVVHVLDSSSSQMKIGISAPREIPVYRNEVYEKIEAENRAASLQRPDLGAALDGLRKLSQHVEGGEGEQS